MKSFVAKNSSLQMTALMRTSQLADSQATVMMASRSTLGIGMAAGHTYENLRVRNKKYKSAAKEKRKQVRREAMAGFKSPKETGEELPPFFLPPRYKLLYKLYTEGKNSHRVGRKPIPLDAKRAFAAHAKEYQAYKHAEKMRLRQENFVVTKC